MKIRIILCLVLCLSMQLAAQQKHILGEPIDMSLDFKDFHNTFFFADKLASFNAADGKGKITWKRSSLYTRQAFNVNTILPQDLKMLDFPGEAYEQDPDLDFTIDFITLRIRMLTTPVQPKPLDSPMLAKEPGKDHSWKYSKLGKAHIYKSNYGSIEIEENPFRIILRDEKGKQLTETWRWCDNDSSQVKVIPFNFIKRGVEAGNNRNVYLPNGNWIDYQSGKTYQQGWNTIETGKIPAVILVREGAVIPHAKLAQSTDKIEWADIELKVYGKKEKATGLICLPSENQLTDVILIKSGNNYQIEKGQIKGINYKINK